MAENETLNEAELNSLKEIGRGVLQHSTPAEHKERLLALKLIYKLLGDLRITGKGRAVLNKGR